MIKTILLFCFIIIQQPLWAISTRLDAKKWRKITYSKGKSNSVKQIENRLHITVDNSSSALVYKFDKPINIRNVEIEAKLKGSINYGKKTPGSKQADDFPLRLGFILKGDNKLNFFQKAIAPKWLKELDEISSDAGGLDKVYSLIYYSLKPDFEEREHPLSSYFVEVVGGSFKNSKLKEKYSFLTKKEIIGLWLSSDGDDTNSSYEVIIENITLN